MEIFAIVSFERTDLSREGSNFSNIANVENQRYSVDIKARKNSKTIYVSTRGRLEEVAARLGDEINS